MGEGSANWVGVPGTMMGLAQPPLAHAAQQRTLGRPPLVTTTPPLLPPKNPNPVKLPPPDMARAAADAARTLADIDWSRELIVIWVPGTNRRGIPESFSVPAAAMWSNTLSLVELRYPASYDVRQGASTGAATIRIVLEAIAAQSKRDGKRRRVHLAGESQGSWAVLEATASPSTRALVDRVGVVGVPFGASRHHITGGDPKTIELSRRSDPVARPVKGDQNGALVAAEMIQTGKFSWTGIKALISGALANPLTAAYLVLSGIRIQLPGGADRDPHNYEDILPAVVRFLAVT